MHRDQSMARVVAAGQPLGPCLAGERRFGAPVLYDFCAVRIFGDLRNRVRIGLLLPASPSSPPVGDARQIAVTVLETAAASCSAVVT